MLFNIYVKLSLVVSRKIVHFEYFCRGGILSGFKVPEKNQINIVAEIDCSSWPKVTQGYTVVSVLTVWLLHCWLSAMQPKSGIIDMALIWHTTCCHQQQYSSSQGRKSCCSFKRIILRYHGPCKLVFRIEYFILTFLPILATNINIFFINHIIHIIDGKNLEITQKSLLGRGILRGWGHLDLTKTQEVGQIWQKLKVSIYFGSNVKEK